MNKLLCDRCNKEYEFDEEEVRRGWRWLEVTLTKKGEESFYDRFDFCVECAFNVKTELRRKIDR